MEDQHGYSGGRMLIIGAHDANLRLACESCGAHAIRASDVLFWATRCHVCGEIGEVHGARTRISEPRVADATRDRLSFPRER